MFQRKFQNAKNAGVHSGFSFEFSVERILVCSAMKMSFSKNGQVRNISECYVKLLCDVEGSRYANFISILLAYLISAISP